MNNFTPRAQQVLALARKEAGARSKVIPFQSNAGRKHS